MSFQQLPNPGPPHAVIGVYCLARWLDQLQSLVSMSRPECERQVKGYSGARFKSFATLEEAEHFMIFAVPKAGPSSSEKKRKKTKKGCDVEGFYAVVVGAEDGLYVTYDECADRVLEDPEAAYEWHETEEAARDWIAEERRRRGLDNTPQVKQEADEAQSRIWDKKYDPFKSGDLFVAVPDSVLTTDDTVVAHDSPRIFKPPTEVVCVRGVNGLEWRRVQITIWRRIGLRMPAPDGEVRVYDSTGGEPESEKMNERIHERMMEAFRKRLTWVPADLSDRQIQARPNDQLFFIDVDGDSALRADLLWQYRLLPDDLNGEVVLEEFNVLTVIDDLEDDTSNGDGTEQWDEESTSTGPDADEGVDA